MSFYSRVMIRQYIYSNSLISVVLEIGGIIVKKNVLAAFLLCLAVAASGCTTHGTGSGNVANQIKSVQGVNQVSLDGIGTVILHQGNQESLTIEAEDNIIPHILRICNRIK